MANAITCSFSVLVVFMRQMISTKVLLCSLLANIFASHCYCPCGINSFLGVTSFVFGIESIISGVVSSIFCNISNLFLVTTVGDRSSDVCICGIASGLVSGITTISVGVWVFWLLGVFFCCCCCCWLSSFSVFFSGVCVCVCVHAFKFIFYFPSLFILCAVFISLRVGLGLIFCWSETKISYFGVVYKFLSVGMELVVIKNLLFCIFNNIFFG